MNDERICFIGAGNMASAIINGLVSKGVDPANIIASCPSQEQLDALSKASGIETTTNNHEAVHNADVIVLAVKPQILQAVCEDLSDSLAHKPLIISIAAGVEIVSLSHWLGTDLPIVRCMPNTPAQVLKGASGIVANELVSDDQCHLAYDLFSAIGVVEWLDSEEQIHAITALSGSGPAYVFLVIEAMEAAAQKLGIAPDIARQMAAQTVSGAAEMVLQSDLDPAQLKRNVMSPGGTTERAIHTFEEQGLVTIFETAMKAAADRSVELAELMKNN